MTWSLAVLRRKRIAALMVVDVFQVMNGVDRRNR
jgi:hypothetical protein